MKMILETIKSKLEVILIIFNIILKKVFMFPKNVVKPGMLMEDGLAS